MICGMLGINAGAMEAEMTREGDGGISAYDGYDLYSALDGRYHLSISTVANKNMSSYPAFSVSINGTALSVSGRIINGTYYIPTSPSIGIVKNPNRISVPKTATSVKI